MAIAAPLVVPAAEALWGAIVAVGSALAVAVGIAATKDKIDQTFSKSEPSAEQPCPESDKPIDFDDPSSVKGKDPEEVEQAIPDDWSESPAKTGRGKRFADPDHPGDQIRVMDGNPADPDPVKQGPYVRVSKSGKVSDPIPLKGNPTLGSGNQ